MNILILCVGAILVLVLVLGIYIRQLKSFSRRRSLTHDELKSLYDVSGESEDFFVEILSLIGRSYRIDYEKLRPDDSFYGNLGNLDSWSLEGGNENLSKELTAHEIKDFNGKMLTVKELVELYIEKKRSSGSESSSP